MTRVLLMAVMLCGVSQAARVGITGSRQLTLEDAVTMALRDNLDVRIERSNVASAQEAEVGSRGIYDPVFRFQPQLQILNTPSPSILAGQNGRASEHDFVGSAGYRQRGWQGAIFDLSADGGRTSTNNPFIGLNPYYTSQVRLGVTQPLLRGRTIDAERALIRIRAVQTGMARTQLELRAIDTVTRVVEAYWDLATARDSAEVNREAADLARTQLEQNRRMIAAGSLAAIELSASEAELERRLDHWYAALDDITTAENNLKQLIAPHREDPVWSQELIVETGQEKVPTAAGGLTEAVAAALKARPELRGIGQELAVNGIEEQQNADQIRPALNLVASYSNAGLTGTPREAFGPLLAVFGPLPPLQPDGRFHSVQAGLNFEWTAHNRQTRANLEQSAIGERKLKLQRTRVEQSIEAQVRNAMQSLETARQRIAAAEAGTRAAREKLDSEQRLFSTGESTNFLVLTRQNEYSDARQRLLAARLYFNKAIARFEEAVGETLSARRLVLD